MRSQGAEGRGQKLISPPGGTALGSVTKNVLRGSALLRPAASILPGNSGGRQIRFAASESPFGSLRIRHGKARLRGCGKLRRITVQTVPRLPKSDFRPVKVGLHPKGKSHLAISSFVIRHSSFPPEVARA